MSGILQCVDGMKPVVKRTYNFPDQTYVWLLCENCKDKASYQNWDAEEQLAQ